MLFKFPAQATATAVFEVVGRAEIPVDIFCAAWNGASFTLTVDRGNGTYHSLKPATDPTDPLTGVAFEVSGDLTTALVLGAGVYGVTIADATPTNPIYLHMTHKQLRAADNTETYATVS